MKLHQIALFLIGSRLMAMPEGPAQTEEVKDSAVDKIKSLDLSTIKSWAEEGAKIGGKIVAVLEKGESIMQETLLVYAKALAGQPSADDWLTGYSGSFKAEQSKKNRKSEAKAVFGAWASNHQVERVDYSTAELVEKARKGEPVKVSKTTREWLAEAPKGYHAFIQLAKELAPRATDASTQGSGTTQAVKTMTDKGHKRLLEELPRATGMQADQIINAAVKQVKKQPGFEMKLFGHIVGLCNEIKTNSNNVAMLDVAAAIIDEVAKLAKVTPGAGTQVAAPAPAVAPQAAAVEQSEPEWAKGMSTDEIKQSVIEYGDEVLTLKGNKMNSRAGWIAVCDEINAIEEALPQVAAA